MPGYKYRHISLCEFTGHEKEGPEKKKNFSSTIHSNPERGIVKEPWEHTEGDSARRC